MQKRTLGNCERVVKVRWYWCEQRCKYRWIETNV